MNSTNHSIWQSLFSDRLCIAAILVLSMVGIAAVAVEPADSARIDYASLNATYHPGAHALNEFFNRH